MTRPRSEAARVKVLDAAADIVLNVGVPGFTIDEVARRSGVAKTTIYRHFSSGNELLIAALDQTIAPFATPDTGSFRGDLVTFLRATMPIFSDPLVRSVMLDILAAAARDDELRHIHTAMVVERMTPMRTIFERAQKRGEVSKTLDFDIAFDFIEGPFIARWLMRPEMLKDIDIETAVDRVVACLAH
jgi:AcrR family transcriptional regulator